MLTHYLEIHCQTPPNETGWMLGKMIQQIHGFLASTGRQDIAIALPQLKSNHPGDSLRIFGPFKGLEQLLRETRLAHLEAGGAIQMAGGIQSVPEHTAFATYSRSRQVEKGSANQLKKRMDRFLQHLKKKGVQADKVLLEERKKRFLASTKEEHAYLSLNSSSTGQHFQLVITKKVVSSARAGSFGTYGLAGGHHGSTTVPEFL